MRLHKQIAWNCLSIAPPTWVPKHETHAGLSARVAVASASSISTTSTIGTRGPSASSGSIRQSENIGYRINQRQRSGNRFTRLSFVIERASRCPAVHSCVSPSCSVPPTLLLRGRILRHIRVKSRQFLPNWWRIIQFVSSNSTTQKKKRCLLNNARTFLRSHRHAPPDRRDRRDRRILRET